MNQKRYIPVAAPVFPGNEKVYAADCLDSTWISSNGPYIERFESAFAGFCGARRAVACCNGTVALHLALMALGVGPGDEVIVPTLTFVAPANAVTYCGARPVFVDAEPETWNIDPALIDGKITPRTKAIIVVHLYGHPADMDPILAIARRRGLPVIEDAAEAHGALYRGRKVGSLGDIATFSFCGDSIITTGEGGMVVTDSDELEARLRQLKRQGMDPARRYWFPVIGYNYRMTNLAAAIGLAQIEKVDYHLERRREVAAWYAAELGGVPSLTLPAEKEWARNVYWMYSVVLGEDVRTDRDTIMAHLLEEGIETRPFFYPMHRLPPYRATSWGEFPAADRLGARGINLPTWAGVTRDDVRFISRTLRESIGATP